MPLNLDIDHKSTAWLGIVLGLGAWLLAKLIQFLDIPTVKITLSTIDVNVRDAAVANFQGVASGVNTGIAARLLGGITGLIPEGIATSLFFAVLGGFLVVYAGVLVKHWIGFGERFTDTQALVATLATGSVIWGVILGSFLVPNQTWFDTVVSFRWIGAVLSIAIYSTVLVFWLKLVEKTGFVRINPV